MKTRTLKQVEAAQRKAVLAAHNLLQDDDRADEIEAMTPEEYAESKSIEIVSNPSHSKTKGKIMATTVKELRARIRDLEDENEELVDTLSTIRGLADSEIEEDEEEAEEEDDGE